MIVMRSTIALKVRDFAVKIQCERVKPTMKANAFARREG